MTDVSVEVCDCGCGEPVDADLEQETTNDSASCAATFREDPMPYAVHCGETGYHQRHTAWEGSNYYAWLDGDEGAGREQ